MKKALLPLAIAAVVNSAYAGTVITDGADIKIKTKGGLSAETTDGKASVQLGGRLQWDYDATEAEDDAGEIDSKDFDVRRARLFVAGHYGDWQYKIQFNVAESDGADGGTAEDLYVSYTGFGQLANITVGKQKEPFGLEELTSSKDTSMLERSALTEFFAPGRNAGIQVHGKGTNWTYGVGFFEADGDGSDDFGNTAITGRGTFAPLLSDNMVLHLGAGMTIRNVDVDDDSTTNDEFDAFNLEAAFVMGPFHVQSEYFDADLSSEDETYDSHADGYYVQAGWVITGEMRPYKDGIFKRVKPTADTGAWEVVLRYESGDGSYSDIGLRPESPELYEKGEQMGLGVNWYANENVRLGLSYMDGEEDNSGNDGDELRARVQFAF